MGRIFHLIPHTHWDREWYLPRAAFVARLVPMMDDLVARLEADSSIPAFLLDGQTIHLDDYLAVRPERREAIAALVGSGRLEAGPWYVLADELIPSGEALVRNLLIGSAEARALGRRSGALYSPDAFGHPAAWPSLGREFGMHVGALWRGRRGDRDLFRWRGRDGAELVTYHLPPAGYEVGSALPEGWAGIRDELIRRAATRHIAVFVGADHHAVHPALADLRRRIAALEPDAEVRISRLDEFLAAAADARAPLAEGELRDSYGYTWTLQGVHGTRAPFKRRNAVAELHLSRFAEPLAMLVRMAGGDDRRPLLTAAWRELIQSQFHDTIGGCAADPVIREAAVRQHSALAIAREVSRGALGQLVGYDADEARERPSGRAPSLVCWNPAPRARSGVVIATATFFRRDVLVGPPTGRRPREAAPPAGFALRTPEGAELPVQVLERRLALERIDAPRHYPDLDEVDEVRIAFRGPPIGGLGAAILTTAPARAAPGGAVSADGFTLTNDHIEVTLDADGTVAVSRRPRGARQGGLLTLESEGDAGDTYTFAPVPGTMRRFRGPARRTLVAAGPLVGAMDAEGRFAGMRFRLRVILVEGEPFVRCVLDLDNHARNRRVRLRVPSGVSADVATAGAAFGSVRRPPKPAAGAPMEAAPATAPAHRWVAAARRDRGLAILAPGFFEYEWTGRDFLLTLLRSVGQLSRGDLPTRPGHAGWATPTPEAQCIGPTRIELALAPCTERDVRETDRLERCWEDAFLPVRGMWLRDALPLRTTSRTIELFGDGLVPSALKPAEDGDGSILRCWNARDDAMDGAWRITPPPRRAERTHADERAGTPSLVGDDGTIAFRAGPGEIVSFRIR